MEAGTLTNRSIQRDRAPSTLSRYFTETKA